jgi:hypothetical protein
MNPNQLVALPVTTLGSFEFLEGEAINTFTDFLSEIQIKHPQASLTPVAITNGRFVLVSEEEIEIEEYMFLAEDQEKPYIQHHIGSIIRIEHPLPIEKGSKLGNSGFKILRGKGNLIFQAIAHCKTGILLG